MILIDLARPSGGLAGFILANSAGWAFATKRIGGIVLIIVVLGDAS